MFRKMLHQAQCRRGVTIVKVAVAMPVLVGFVALAADVGVVYNSRAEMQRTADAAALASISEVAFAAPGVNPLPAATEVATDYVNRNTVLGHTITIDPGSDVEFGRADYDVNENKYNFVPGNVPTNAVRVTVRQTEGSVNGPTRLFFASILGKDVTDVNASAVAIFVGTQHEEADCFDIVPPGEVMMCHVEGDSDDSDDSEIGDSDDSDDSSQGDSDGAHHGDVDDSDDSEFGDSDDSDDSQGDGSHDDDPGDSESAADPSDSDSPHTILAEMVAAPLFLQEGDTLGPCVCVPGDSDDSDDSQAGDSGDSDDSDPGDSDGSVNGDSDDSDDSAAGDSDDSDDSHPGGSDNFDDTDDSGGYGGPDPGGFTGGAAAARVAICHIPPGHPNSPQSRMVRASSVSAHLAHGDSLGPCPADVQVFLIQ